MDYGTRIRVMRAARNMSQLDLAEAAGIVNRDLSYIETGRMLPSPEMETAIKSALRWPANAEVAFAILERGNAE